MRAWFETESDALAYCSDTCDDTCEAAWLDGRVIVLATVHVVRDEAGDVLQAIVERRVHASPRRIAAAAANLALVCRDERFRHVFESDKVLRAALTVLEDALQGGGAFPQSMTLGPSEPYPIPTKPVRYLTFGQLMGSWPGNETDEEIAEALEDLRGGTERRTQPGDN